jgi:DNA-binding NarL/FixJ family response regulator
MNPAIKPMRSVSIVVVDDHPVVLRGLITLLSEDKMFKVIGSCNDGAEAIDIIRNLKPCIALLDMKMPTNGLQVLKAVTADKIPTRICFLAAFLTDQEIVAATAGGVHGIVLKETAPETLMSCLHAVAAGQKWLPINLVDGALRRTLESRAQITKLERLLTRREIDVMVKVADGLSNKEVAGQLNISEGTVKIHLHSIYNKVGVSNRTSLANFAVEYRDRLGLYKIK